MKSVYHIFERIKTLTDKRKRKSIPLFNIVMPVLIGFILQYPSFNEIFTYGTSWKRMGNCVKGRLPKLDAARQMLKLLDIEEVRSIQEDMVKKIYANKTFRHGTIGGYKVAAIDGVEFMASTVKFCKNCLSRKLSNGKIEHFHRSVVCMTVGCDPHIILGETMLKPRDGDEKEEGELTGGKRLIETLYHKYHHFADVIVADALYLNAPLINKVIECGMEVVIRQKDEKRLIQKDAEGLFRMEGQIPDFKSGKVCVKGWDLCGFTMEGAKRPLRVLKFIETHPILGKSRETEERMVWIVTTLENADSQTIWQMMHKRWDIEENGFHQLKTYYHASHCFEHAAIETVFLLNIIAYNSREMYQYCRKHGFRKSGMPRREFTKCLDDVFLIGSYKKIIYDG